MHVGDVLVAAAGVDDHEQAVGAARHHQVVEDAAVVSGEERIALLEQAQVDDVDGHEGLERGGGVVAHQQHLAHVGDVEQAGLGAGVLVLGHHAGGVLDRHVVAGEGHHLGAQFEVQRVQGGLVQGRVQVLIGGHVSLRGHSS